MRRLYYVLQRKAIWGLCAFTLIAAACNNDDNDPQTVDRGAPVEAGQPVEATLSLSIGEAHSSIHTYSTRSSRAAQSVSNLWILEYAADGKLLASEKIDSYSADKQIKVNLIAGSNIDLYAIAGAGDMSFSEMTLSDLKAAAWGGGAAKLADLPYAGHAKVDIAYANFSSNDLSLERIGSEVKIAYVVDGESPYSVTSFQLKNVPTKFRFISGAAVAAGDVEDKVVITENLGEVYTYIIPENLQGVDESIKNAKDKKTDKPATCVEIKGTYEDASIATIFNSSYKMYLGENNTNDFNVCRNKLYSFIGNLRMEDDSDNRVDTDKLPAPYTQPESNCYMLTPNAEHALAIPVSRVNTFWDKADSRNSLNNGDNDSKIQKWVVKVIWQDVQGEIIKFDKAEGMMADEKFIVAPVGAEGNVIVGIYDATSGTDIDVATATPLWSWHIWVTAYSPGDKNWVPMPAYSADQMMDSSDNWAKRSAYSVPGGKIYQHNAILQGTSAPISTTIDQAIMDRNLGALSSDKAAFEKTIGFYYQWGRKDPFMATPPAGTGESWVIESIDFTTKAAQEVAFTVKNPTKYIAMVGDWCTPTSDYLWNGGNSTYVIAKSIYDPCPVGWMMPKYDAFQPLTVGSGYTMDGTYKPYVSRSKALSGTTAQNLADAFGSGYLFWPDDMQAWYPAAGRINGGSGKMFEYKSTGCWWSWYPSSGKGSAYKLSQYDANEDEDNMYHWRLCTNEAMGSNQVRASGVNVRCVLEK